jgi:uncharacterized membrane protein
MKNVNIAEGIPSIMRIKAISKLLIFFFIIIFLFNAITPMVLAQNSPPVLSKGIVTPRTGRPNIDYLFTVTYTDADNDAPASIKVFIDQLDYEMEEVDPTDRNYSDGKEYFFSMVLGEGSYSIYYSADDANGNVVNSNSFTLSVTWSVGHYDIIHFIEDEIFPKLMLMLIIVFVVIFVLCVISIFMVLQLRRIAKELEGKEKGEEEGKERQSKKDVKENSTQ